MKFLLNIVLVVYTTEACRHGKCKAFCAGEIKAPSKKLTFYTETALATFNENFEGDEKFVYVHDGKCVYDQDCCDYKESLICAIPEPGASGFPMTFSNFCEMNLFNCDNLDNEYLYYHDDTCNNLDDATPSKDECDCLECDNEPWKPVCAYPLDPAQAQPISFSNYCWLQKFNCEIPEYQFLFWHEDICLSDPLHN